MNMPFINFCEKKIHNFHVSSFACRTKRNDPKIGTFFDEKLNDFHFSPFCGTL